MFSERKIGTFSDKTKFFAHFRFASPTHRGASAHQNNPRRATKFRATFGRNDTLFGHFFRFFCGRHL